MIGRRTFLAAAAGAWIGIPLPRVRALRAETSTGKEPMYGLIGQIMAVEGRRDELAAILLEGISGMPGCLSYVVARDASDPDALWVTEVWESEARHGESLSLPSVQEAIRKGRSLIAGFGQRFVTEPLGGQGLR